MDLSKRRRVKYGRADSNPQCLQCVIAFGTNCRMAERWRACSERCCYERMDLRE